MRRVFVISVLFLFVFSTVADAQRWRTRRWEAVIGAGTANHYGDIGGSLDRANAWGLKDYQISYTRPSVTTGFKFKINHRFNARFSVTGAYLTGTDAGSKHEGDIGRNGGYAFNSWILEPAALGEFWILPENRSMVSGAIYNRKGMVNTFRTLYLYLFGGVGGVFTVTEPNVTYISNGLPVLVDGQINDVYQEADRPFRRGGVVFPIGIGARIDLTSYWTMGAEFGRRYTLFDYTDGYRSKFSNATDVYDFVNVVFTYRIRTNLKGLPVLRDTGLN